MGKTRLYFTASVREQWEDLAGPWLRELADKAWRNPLPTVVLTPSRAESFFLRSRLVEEGLNYFGLRFWTPSDARKFLLAETSPEITTTTQGELRLVARACAEKLAARGKKDNATLASVIREPGAFLRAYDLLLSAGWDLAKDGAIYGRDLALTMQRELSELGIDTQAGLHRHLLNKITTNTVPLLGNLLVVGLNASHWPLWDLLKATTLAADDASVAILHPRRFAEKLDELWLGSWEEFARAVAVHPSGEFIGMASRMPDSPFKPLADSYEQGTLVITHKADLSFLVTPNLAAQIRAVTLQALHCLKRKDCTRLGIVFPEANALALGVAADLRKLEIPLDDGTGALTPGLFEMRCWQTWIALQEEPSVERLIPWLRSCDAQGISWGLEDHSAQETAERIDAALGETLVDDLDFLASHLEAGAGRDDYGAIAGFLRNRIALPDQATFRDFLALTRKAMSLRGWEEYLARLQIDPPAWLCAYEDVLSRRAFLEWLKEATDSQVRTRGAEGNHFYGKVHLLVYGQMTGQIWSHLVLTGLNEGVWPRVFEAGAFGSRYDLNALNDRARVLNRRGVTQGGQGEGHETVAEGKGYCLIPLERQDLALRDLCAALEATSHAVCLTSLTTDGGRSLLPSDFFNHAYQTHTGERLDEETFRRLAAETDVWCRKHDSLLEPKAVNADIDATLIAYQARRDAKKHFGRYEFAFAQPPAEPIQLSCKSWENAWNHPSSAWFENVIGASSWPEGLLSWPRATGTWVHRWLAAALRDCRARNSTAELPVLLWAAASRDAAAARDRAKSTGLDLYPWWSQVWMQSRTVALGLAEVLPPALHDRQFLPEHWIPRDLKIALPGSDVADFVLRGRMDLLLLEPKNHEKSSSPDDYTGRTGWVIDFKTGSAKRLTAKMIERGVGLQTVLYAMAVRALGSNTTAISIQTPGTLIEPQIELEDFVETTQLFRSLNKLHHDGIFGMRPDAENEYGYTPAYPLATRFISNDILEAKWALVHGSSGEVGDA